MNNVIEYKGYIGSIEFSEKDIIFFGKVLGIKALISYEGKDAPSLIENFHNAIDSYLKICEEKETEPEKAYKGCFNVRISPELHKQAAIIANRNQITLNGFVENSIKQAIASNR